MKTPREKLLNEVLSEKDVCAASLEGVLGAVRAQRRRRKISTAVAAVSICLLATALIFFQVNSPNSQKTETTAVLAVQSSPQTIPGTKIHVLNDSELLAMFPNRPIALIGPPDHRELVFLDEYGKGGQSAN